MFSLPGLFTEDTFSDCFQTEPRERRVRPPSPGDGQTAVGGGSVGRGRGSGGGLQREEGVGGIGRVTGRSAKRARIVSGSTRRCRFFILFSTNVFLWTTKVERLFTTFFEKWQILIVSLNWFCAHFSRISRLLCSFQPGPPGLPDLLGGPSAQPRLPPLRRPRRGGQRSQVGPARTCNGHRGRGQEDKVSWLKID